MRTVGLPSTTTSPSSGRSSRPAMCSRVDLPLPDWPTNATISPGCRSTDTPRSTSRRRSPWTKVRRMPCSESGLVVSLMSQSFDRFDPGGSPCRIGRRDEREHDRDHDDENHLDRIHTYGHGGDEVDL